MVSHSLTSHNIAVLCMASASRLPLLLHLLSSSCSKPRTREMD